MFNPTGSTSGSHPFHSPVSPTCARSSGPAVPISLVRWQPEPGHDPAEVASRFMYDPNGTPFAVQGDPSFFRPVPGIRLEF